MIFLMLFISKDLEWMIALIKELQNNGYNVGMDLVI